MHDFNTLSKADLAQIHGGVELFHDGPECVAQTVGWGAGAAGTAAMTGAAAPLSGAVGAAGAATGFMMSSACGDGTRSPGGMLVGGAADVAKNFGNYASDPKNWLDNRRWGNPQGPKL